MDSLTHIALGAAIGTAVLGRKAGAKAALWGAICSTLPDLDVLIPYGDPVRDFTFHRAHSHSLFWLALLAPLLALAALRLHRGLQASFREWVTLMGLTLLAHPVLDAFTVYGTQLLLPFTDYPVGSGSIFIIDPLYTLPIIAGLIAYWRLRGRAEPRARRWNSAGIAASTLYLAWSVGAQAHVTGVVERTLAATPAGSGRVLVTPTPFNTLLWRVVVMGDGGYREGYYSVLDRTGRVTLAWHASDGALLDGLRDEWSVQRLAWFAKGFYSVGRAAPDARVARVSASTLAQLLGVVPTAQAADASAGDGRPRIVVSDLRMGQTPWFVFNFVVGALDGHEAAPLPSQQLPSERPPVQVLTWLWQRIWNESAGPPPAA